MGQRRGGVSPVIRIINSYGIHRLHVLCLQGYLGDTKKGLSSGQLSAQEYQVSWWAQEPVHSSDPWGLVGDLKAIVTHLGSWVFWDCGRNDERASHFSYLPLISEFRVTVCGSWRLLRRVAVSSAWVTTEVTILCLHQTRQEGILQIQEVWRPCAGLKASILKAVFL